MRRNAASTTSRVGDYGVLEPKLRQTILRETAARLVAHRAGNDEVTFKVGISTE
jgi:hypothetical protein